jgi:hypothetical protein
MANTFTLFNQGISFAAGKVMAGIFNEGARVLRVRRIGLLNTQTSSVTGVMCQLDVRRYTATATWSGSSAVTPVKHDSNNSALSSVTAGNSGTPGTSGSTHTFRRVVWSSDEASLSSATADEWECLVPLNIIWDAGYADSNVQPLVIRTDEAVNIYNVSGAAGLLDSWIEFTDEAS